MNQGEQEGPNTVLMSANRIGEEIQPLFSPKVDLLEQVNQDMDSGRGTLRYGALPPDLYLALN